MKKGFTLIEIILALSIFSTGIIVVLSIFPKAAILGKEAKEITIATQLAQEKIEETLALGYDDTPVGEIEARAKVDPDPTNQFYNFEREVSSTLLDNNLADSVDDIGLKKITVKVYWRENALEKNLELVRLVNKP